MTSMYLSSNSILKTMEILDSQNEISHIAKFRRCSFNINRIAVLNGFDKVNATELRVNLGEKFMTIEIIAELSLSKKNVHPKRKLDVASLAFSSSFQSFRSTGNRLENVFVQKKAIAANQTDAPSFMAPMLMRSFAMVKRIRELSIFGHHLDKQLLEITSKYKDILGTVQTLNIQKCKIEMAEDELTAFLGLFPNLRNLCLSGAFKDAVINDQHLMTACNHVKISNECLPLQMDELSGENIFRHWKENIPKSVSLANITTQIKFTHLWSFLEEVSRNKSVDAKFEQSKEPIEFNLGLIENSEELHKSLVEMQQKSHGFVWAINPSTKKIWYQISTKNGSIIVKFITRRLYIAPKFEILLTIIKTLSTQVTNANEPLDAVFERTTREKLRSVETVMREYEEELKLSDPQLKPLPILEDNGMILGVVEEVREVFARAAAIAPLNNNLHEINFHENILDDLVLIMQEAAGIQVSGERQKLLEDLARMEEIVRLRKTQAEAAKFTQ